MTSEDLLTRQTALQAEADHVGADLQLARLLESRGEAVRVGSAALGLMVRRDLDITVVCPQLDHRTKRAVAAVGAELAVHERVRQVSLRDDTGRWNTDPLYPDGLYVGVEYRAESGAEWTLDIWFVDEPDRQPDLGHLRTLPPRLTDEHRRTILGIKAVLAGRPDTGTRVPSYDVYRAVLDDGITTVDAFDAWLARTRG
ncbi:hypothetical protein [Streptomyces sp. NPDC059009]|uniref:hypothetical protein n=1 Tax=Streptomyces sp. NPDC059009 TaxID=3346694 RepID=UPI0036C01733